MLEAPSDLDRWRRRLYRTTGAPNDYLSWLEPVWHGDPEVARVVLYQVIPARATPPLFFADDQRVILDGTFRKPDPRFRVSILPEMLTHYQWDLYQRFGCFAQPFWIVQGAKGGHKRQFNDIETRLLAGMGLPTTPPLAGDLPYAPVDNRTIDALVPLDEMRMWAKAKDLYERTPDDFDRDEAEALERGSKRLEQWLADQVAHAFDDVLTYRKTAADVFAA